MNNFGMHAGYSTMGHLAHMGSRGMPSYNYQTAHIQLAVPDHLVGSILGRHGTVINQIQSSTGTRIKISEKGDFIGNTKNRGVRISGSMAACQYAAMLISQKVWPGK